MPKNTIRSIMHVMLVVFFCLSHHSNAMLPLGRVATKLPRTAPRPPAPGKIPTLEPVKIPYQPGPRPIEAPIKPSDMPVPTIPSPAMGKPQAIPAPGYKPTKPLGNKPSHLEAIRKNQLLNTTKTVNLEVMENLKKLQEIGHPGSRIAQALIVGDSLESIQKIIKQEEITAQESGYKMGFIGPRAENSRAALAELFEKSLDDISTSMEKWESITINNQPFLEFIQLPDKSIIFLEQSVGPFYPQLIDPTGSTSLISRLEEIIPKHFSDAQGADILRAAKETALKKAETDALAEKTQEDQLKQEVDAEFEQFEKELAEEQIIVDNIEDLAQEVIIAEQAVQQYQKELQNIAQQTEKINAQLDAELEAFEKKQLQEKDQLLKKAQREAQRTQAFNNLDIQEQENFLNRIENNYKEKMAQELAQKKEALSAEKNEKIEAFEKKNASKIQKLNDNQKQLELQKENIQKKIELQAALSLEIIDGTKQLESMLQEAKNTEQALLEIRQNMKTAQKQFDLEKTGNNTSPEIQKLVAEQTQLEEKQVQLQQEQEAHRKNLEQKLMQEQQSLDEKTDALEKAFQSEKSARAEQRKIAQEKTDAQNDSAQKEIEKLEKEWEIKEKQHALSKEIASKQKNKLDEAQALLNEAKKQELQAKRNRVEELKAQKLQLEQEAANKKAELEIINKNAIEAQNAVAQAKKDVDLKQLKQQELEKLTQELTQEKNNDQQALSSAEQESKKLADMATQLEQDLAEKKDIQLKAEMRAQELENARVEAQQALENAVEQTQKLADKQMALEPVQTPAKQQAEPLPQKGSQEDLPEPHIEAEARAQELEKEALEAQKALENAVEQTQKLANKQIALEPVQSPAKQQAEPLPQKGSQEDIAEPHIEGEMRAQEQEQLRKEAEKKERDKENPRNPNDKKEIDIPGGGDDELPDNDEKDNEKPEPLSIPELDELLPTIKPEPLKPLFEIPAISSPEPTSLSGQAPKVGMQNSPEDALQIPPILLDEPVTPTINKQPLPLLPEQENSSIKIRPSETIKPTQNTQPIGSLAPDTDPLSLTPFEPTPFPDVKHSTYKGYKADWDSPSNAPSRTNSYTPTSSSGNFNWPTTEQPYVSPEVKKQPVDQQPTKKEKKLSPKALVFLEKMLSNTQTTSSEEPIPNTKGNNAYLKGLRLLRQQHTKNQKPPTSSPKTEPTDTQKENIKEPLSFTQKITTSIKNAVNTVINTIGEYIQRLFS